MKRGKLHLLLVLLLASPSAAFCGGDNFPVGGRSAALGHASVTLTDIWSAHHNQAGLGWLETPAAGIFYENKFGVRENSVRGGLAAIPTKQGTFALSINAYGFELYSQNKIGLGYGRKLGENISAGVQINYHSLRIGENYGSATAFSAELGVQAKLNDNITLAAHLYNPNRAKLADFNDERIPTIFRLGMRYDFSEKVLAAIEVEKDIDFKPSFKAGLEYHVVEYLYLRAGISTNPALSSFGFGLKFQQFQLDFAASMHNTLGFSPQLSLQYNFGK